MDVHRRLVEGLGRAVGAQRLLEFQRSLALEMIESPLLRSVASKALQLMGWRAMLRAFPRVLPVMLRGYGVPLVEQVDRTSIRIRFVAVPRMICQSEPPRLGFVATFEAVLAYAHQPGEVRLARINVGEQFGQLDFVMVASPPGCGRATAP